MSQYLILKDAIDAAIYENSQQSITGSTLNTVLNSMVTALGKGYQFGGVATPTNPGSAQTPDYKCFYLATTPGTYTNLGGLVVADGEVALLKYDSSWTKEVPGIASAEDTNEKNLITREYVMSAINDGKATISKNSILFSTGYYGVTDGVIIHHTGLHNCVKIPAAGYYLDKIVFRGTFVGVLGARNVILERNDGAAFSYTIGVEGESINLSDYFSHSVEAEKLKNVYINYFFIDDNDYKFEFQFDRLNASVDTMTIGEEWPIKGSTLYAKMGISLPNEGYLDIYGNYASTQYWRTSDFVPVVFGDVINYRLSGQANTTATIAFYDKNKTFVSGLIPETTGEISGTISVPENCEYMRCCVIRDLYPTSYVFIDTPYLLKEQFNQLKDRVVSPVDLFDTIKKPIVFSGKVLHAFGDSITAGVSSPNLAPAGENSYINLFKAYAGATLLNYADSGACIVPGRNQVTSIYEKIISISSACDIIMIAGGVNDWQTQSPIGAFGDDNTTTLYGTLKKICDYLKTTYPNAIVIFITPIPTTNTTTFGVQHPDNLNLYRKAIQEVAAYYGYNVVNGAGLGLPDFLGGYGDAMFDPTDCVHPTLAGHLLYARSLCGKLL